VSDRISSAASLGRGAEATSHSKTPAHPHHGPPDLYRGRECPEGVRNPLVHCPEPAGFDPHAVSQ